MRWSLPITLILALLALTVAGAAARNGAARGGETGAAAGAGAGARGGDAGGVAARGATTPGGAAAGGAASTGGGTARGTPGAATGVKPAALRGEWKIPDLKLTREAIDDSSFPPDIRQSAIEAVDWFLSEQEKLITDAGKQTDGVAKARQARAPLQKQFEQKMAVITSNPAYKAELEKRLAALEKEMDDLAAGASKLFADLDAAGLTPQQKARLQPTVDQAGQKLKTAKATAGTLKDEAVREDAVDRLQEARQAVKQQLTPEQRAKMRARQVDAP
jgi:hypothetical protein